MFNTKTTLVSSLLFGACTLLLSGCGMTNGTGSTGANSVTGQGTHSFGGMVHGGQQPIAGATINLYAAGVSGTGATGYGSGSTLVATTTTAGDGSFSFDNSSGASPCTVGQYLYVTAVGGATVGTSVNSASAMMAAIPTPCNTTGTTPTASQNVYVNEITTVAAVWSLQQFMTITPGAATPWKIGAPSTNVKGLANAFLMSSSLVNITNGNTATSSTSNAVTSTVGGNVYTTLVIPDYKKINTLADILAACVNTINSGTSPSNTCASLFTDTTPSGSTAPTDTIQVAYYLATNPAGLTMPAHGNTAGSPSYLCGAYPTSTPPYPTTSTCSSLYEWTIGVSMKATAVLGGTTTTVGTVYAASVALDGNGNVWVGSGTGYTATAGAINELSPTGQVLTAPITTATIPAYTFNYDVASTLYPTAYTGSTATLGYGRPLSLAIDTSNNVWFNSYGSASPGTFTSGAETYSTGVLVEVSPSLTVTGYLSSAANGPMAISGTNDIFTSGDPVSSRYFMSELTNASTYTTLNEGLGRSTSSYNQVSIDSSGYAMIFSAAACAAGATSTIQRGLTADEAAAATSPVAPASTVTATGVCAFQGTPDAAGNIWVVGNGNLSYLNINGTGATPAAPIVTTVTGSTNTVNTAAGGPGGLDGPVHVSIDGAGNLWVTNRLSGTTAGYNGLSEFVPTTTGTTTTVAALSPSAAGVYGFGSGEGATGLNATAIDSSGNVWTMTTSGSLLYYFVGAAAPVVTPMAQMLAKSAIGTRP